MIIIATRSNKPVGSYICPMVDDLEIEDGTCELVDEWKVIDFFPRRGRRDPNGVCIEMPKEAGSGYAWEAIVAVKQDEDDTAESLGKHVAAKFTAYAKESPKYSKEMPFVFRKAHTENPRAVNHYLLDMDVIQLMKRIYSESTLAELIEDTEIMVSFWGDAVIGELALRNISEEQWESM